MSEARRYRTPRRRHRSHRKTSLCVLRSDGRRRCRGRCGRRARVIIQSRTITTISNRVVCVYLCLITRARIAKRRLTAYSLKEWTSLALDHHLHSTPHVCALYVLRICRAESLCGTVMRCGIAKSRPKSLGNSWNLDHIQCHAEMRPLMVSRCRCIQCG